MKFSGISTGAWRCIGGTALVALAGLAGCGGGTVIDPFRPTRILAFGDEQSVILQNGTAEGRKYGINAVGTALDGSSNAVYDCTADPLWIQSVANAFGLVFQECLGTQSQASGRILAQAGADVDRVAAQIDTFMAVDNFTGSDIVTVMAGTNDVLEQYALYPATDEADLEAALTAKGQELALAVNRIATSGAPVVASRIPDVGETPFGVAQGADNAALLSRMTLAFNTGLQLNLINDGHLIGLVFGDATIRTMVEIPGNFGLIDVTDAACIDTALADLPNCTDGTATLITGATGGNFLWAGQVQLSPTGQSELGAAAALRATNNPFGG